MLYDPKWEVKTKADPFSLAGLIGWLETQNPTETYCYADNGLCLLSQYFSARGYTNVNMASFGFSSKEGFRDLPAGFNDIALDRGAALMGRDWTFGGALERARKFDGI